MLLIKSLWTICLVCLIFSSSVSYSHIPTFPSDIMNLSKQDKALIRDLMLINYPPKPWKIESDDSSFDYDVAIIGAGMAGLTAGAALFKEGVFNIKLFDQNTMGSEGPWITYARMKTLRSPKELMGPALDIPHLTFHAWFEAQWGPAAWKQLGKIPTEMWMQYLNWYRQAMQLPVENHCRLMALTPISGGFELQFEQQGKPLIVRAHKVVLATGRGGFGGPYIPECVKHLPSSIYAHTVDPIDFTTLKDRRIGILGVGASAFDAAATAIEAGAKSVDVIMRRSRLPNINKFASIYYKSFSHGYYKLNNEQRWEFMCTGFGPGIPPPIEALKRLQDRENLSLRANTTISQIRFDGSHIDVETNQGTYQYDFIILGTGFQINGFQQTELSQFIDQIAFWKDYMPSEKVKAHPELGSFPYLGPCFEFTSKDPEAAPYLKNLYCFNYGSTLSHGLLSSDIPAISIGAKRLAEGIAADFFIQDYAKYLEQLRNFQQEDFDQDHYFPNP